MDNKKIYNDLFNDLTIKILRIRLENNFNLTKEELRTLLDYIKKETDELATTLNKEKKLYLFTKICLSLLKNYDKGSNMMLEVITNADNLSNNQKRMLLDLKQGYTATKYDLTNEKVLFLFKLKNLTADFQMNRIQYVGDNYKYLDKYRIIKPAVYEIATEKLEQAINIEKEIKQLKKTNNKK
jgi:hypothetical protein